MIRRDAGNDWLLISQTAHASLSADIARHLSTPLPENVLTAISLHDAGWPLHDNQPRLNSAGQPIDVFESTPDISIPVWTESARLAVEADPYAGLLVSLHVLHLSAYATGASPGKHEHFDLSHQRTLFAVNQFQHAQLLQQEHLRKQLGLPTDVPLTFGLAAPHSHPLEDTLRYHFRLLQAMDLLSLAICCTHPPSPTTQDIHLSPAAPPVRLSLHRPTPDRLTVSPWPFSSTDISLTLPARRLPAIPFTSHEAFLNAYANAAPETLSLTLTS